MEKEDKICPMRLQTFETNTRTSFEAKLQLCKCLKDKCQWWSNRSDMCSIQYLGYG